MSNIIKIGLGLALAVIYPFMVGFGIEAFYASPKQPYDVCLHLDPNAKVQIPESQKFAVDPKTDQQYKKCFDDAQEKLDIYNRNLFLAATAFGFIAIATGTLLLTEKIGPVGPGLVFGGLFTIVYGTGRTFRSLDKRWIFAELLIVFIGIIFVTWRYLKTAKDN
jgi:hypothetical protein